MGGERTRSGVGSGDPTVLIVDDDRDLADLYAAWLDDRYDVRTAYGGEEALETFRRERHAIDAVLLDRRMPDLHGDMVLVSVRDAGFDCPVALVTAVDPDFDVLGRGFDDYVRKPASRETLLATVEGLLELESYDALARELSAKRVRRNVLRVEKSETELAASEAFAGLEREIARLERRLERVRDRAGTGRRQRAVLAN
jgi:DNA-binding response OmpR family regulator